MKDIIAKWYRKLDFPQEFDLQFNELLDSADYLTPCTIEEYEIIDNEENRGKNLLMYLYFCEALSKKYAERNIPEEFLIDTMKDIPRWSQLNFEYTGKVGLIEPFWIKNHLVLRLFKCGRLQYCIDKIYIDIPEINVVRLDAVLGVHIPAGESFKPELCRESFDIARKFFKDYFPEVDYKCFTCHSWLLDTTLEKYLKADSNIIQFGRMFTHISEEQSDDILKFSLNWYANRNNIESFTPKSSFAKRIVDAVKSGENFKVRYGYILK